MREIENIASELFDKIRTRFEGVTLGDETAKATADPEKARYFNFDYEINGEKYGNITLSLIDETGLKIYFSKDMVDRLQSSEDTMDADDGDDKEQQWYDFLRSLRKFAKRNQLTFDTRDITKSNLDIRDIKQHSKDNSILTKSDLSVTESKLHGTSRSSYRECGPVRVIIRHSDNIDEEKHGARTRNIESVFVETHLGERFLLPEKNLHYASAMARHISEGGRIEDELGESITAMCQEMNHMRHFVRGVRNREFEDQETNDMAQAATQHYNQLKSQLKHIGGRRGYGSYKETYLPESNIENDVDIAALRERFVKKIYDDRFDNALPYVERAYRRQKECMETPMADEFSNWANEVTEGTWEEPKDEQDINDLDILMSNPLEVGIDGDNAISTLQGIIGDDDLNDALAILSRESPEKESADARPEIIAYLNKTNPELAAKYNTDYQQPTAPEQPATPNQTVGATTTDEPTADLGQQPAQPTESADPLEFIKLLAGLRSRK